MSTTAWWHCPMEFHERHPRQPKFSICNVFHVRERGQGSCTRAGSGFTHVGLFRNTHSRKNTQFQCSVKQ